MPSPVSEHTVPWPEADAARYVADGYWAEIPLGDLVRAAADRTPDAPAVADLASGLRLTYAGLADRADALAGRLFSLGAAVRSRLGAR